MARLGRRRELVRTAVAGVLLAGVLCGRSAEARATQPARLDERDLRLELGLGYMDDEHMGEGAYLHLLGLLRHGYAQGGLVTDLSTQVFGGNRGFVGAGIGPVWRADSGLRLDALAAFGVVAYSGVGCGLFCRSGGASLLARHAQLRASVGYAFGARRRFVLSAGSVIGTSPEREVSYETVTVGLFSDETSQNQHSATLGGESAAFLLGFGGVFGL